MPSGNVSSSCNLALLEFIYRGVAEGKYTRQLQRHGKSKPLTAFPSNITIMQREVFTEHIAQQTPAILAPES